MSYQHSTAYRRAFDLAERVFHISKNWDYRYEDLRYQITRSADSVSSNIIEGLSAPTCGKQLQFLSIAYASAGETLGHLERCCARELIQPEEFNILRAGFSGLMYMIRGLANHIASRDQSYQGPLRAWATNARNRSKNEH